MSTRADVLLSLALALAAMSDLSVAQSGEPGFPKSGGIESAGMYSHYAGEGSMVSRRYLGNAGADVLSAAELMPALMAALDQISKYHRLVAWPEILRVPHERIEALVCKAKCGALAAYRPGEGIYLDDRLKPETVLFDRSVLLHELVHYAQDMSEELGEMRPCQRWYQREQEAYAIQKTFLALLGSPIRVGFSAKESTCADETKVH